MSMNNPIQDRMNKLLLKWTIAINTPNVKIVRILSEADEQDMIDTYFEYMLALDTDQEDFVMVLESPISSLNDFGERLIKEIEEEVNQWNEAEIPDSIAFEKITWKPDYSLGSGDNPAQLFIKNLNNFANTIVPKKNMKVSIVIKALFTNKEQAYKWFEAVLDSPMEPHLIFGITDATNSAVFDKIAKDYPEEVYTIIPDLNVDDAIEQLAAMGDPNETETPYRKNLVKLMNAVKNRKKEKVQLTAKACLDIATKSLEKDANWLAQIVTIYTILYNDQVGYKKYKDAIFFAEKAIESAIISKQLIDPEIAYRLVGQTHMGRGSLYAIRKEREKALEDYNLAAEAYAFCNDHLMQCESLRLSGWICNKMSRNKEATQYYLTAYKLRDKLTPELVRNSTFPYIVKKLVNDSNRYEYLSNDEMDRDLEPIFGEDWREIVEQYGKRPKSVA